ncbi:uncharacterized protein artnb [Danio rerio]|uniref:Uncharacterized protein artnb n=1 Tax=Danio rerio TaxID=7955 RepID=A0AC58I4H6_DANRE
MKDEVLHKKKRERLGHGGRRFTVLLAFEEFVLWLLEEDMPVRKSVARKICCVKEARVDFTREDTLICLREARGCTDLARLKLSISERTVGVWWWPSSRIGAMPSMPSVTSEPCQRRRWQVLVWVLMSLLPLVAGGRSRFRVESEAAVGFGAAGVDDPPLEAFPDVEEELEEGSDSPWHGLFEPSVLIEDDQQPARWERSPRSPDTSDIQTKGARKKKKKKEKEERKRKDKSSRGRHSSRDCRVEKREMRVRDLDMGFESDEIILFKFCVGSCQRSRGNYDLALRALLANGSLPKRTARKGNS